MLFKISLLFTALLSSCSYGSNGDYVSEFKSANTCYIKGEMKESLEILSEIEKQSPDFIPALFLTGKIYYLQNNVQGAQEKWEAVLKIKPFHINAGKWLIRLYISKEMHEEADQLLIKLLEVSPEDPDLLIIAGKLKKNEKQYLEAIEYFEKAFLYEDRLIDAHLDLAEIYSIFGIKEKTLIHLEKALSIGGKEHELYTPVKSLVNSME